MTLVEALLLTLLVVGCVYLVRPLAPASMRDPVRIVVLVLLLLIVAWLLRGRLGDRVDFATALRRLILAATRDHLYLRAYGVEVQAQHADGTVDLLPDALDIRGLGLQHVPIMTSPAGTSVRVEPSTRGLMRFADGDPRKPRIVAWAYQQGSAVVSLDGGHAGVARNGDLVQLLLSEATPISGVVSGGVVTSPNPVPPPPTITTPVPPASQFNGVATIAAPVQGRIFGGAQRIKA